MIPAREGLLDQLATGEDSVNRRIFNALLRARVDGIRFEEGLAERVAEAFVEAKRLVLRRLADARAAGFVSVTDSLSRDLLAEIDRSLAGILDRVTGDLKREIRELAVEEAEMLGTTVEASLRKLAPNALRAVSLVSPPLGLLQGIADGPIVGQTLDRWAAVFRIQNTAGAEAVLTRAVRDGISPFELEGRLADVLDGTGANAEAVARTAVHDALSRADEAWFDENSDVISCERFTATLDDRTCLRCAPLDGREFAVEEPKPSVPIHFSCRCIYTPCLTGELGRGLPESQRAALGGDVPEATTFGAWLREQPRDVQVEVLGPTRWRLWSQGRLSLRSFSAGGEVLTLDELRARFHSVRDRI